MKLDEKNIPEEFKKLAKDQDKTHTQLLNELME